MWFLLSVPIQPSSSEISSCTAASLSWVVYWAQFCFDSFGRTTTKDFRKLLPLPIPPSYFLVFKIRRKNNNTQQHRQANERRKEAIEETERKREASEVRENRVRRQWLWADWLTGCGHVWRERRYLFETLLGFIFLMSNTRVVYFVCWLLHDGVLCVLCWCFSFLGLLEVCFVITFCLVNMFFLWSFSTLFNCERLCNNVLEREITHRCMLVVDTWHSFPRCFR